MKTPIVTMAASLLLRLSAAGDAAGDYIKAYLDGIVVPKVDCEDCTVEEIIDFVRMRMIELDTMNPPERRGVSFLIVGSRRAKEDEDGIDPAVDMADWKPLPKIKIQKRNITVTDLLIEIARQARLDVHVTDVAVVICRAGVPPFPNGKAEKGEITKTLYKVPQHIKSPERPNKAALGNPLPAPS